MAESHVLIIAERDDLVQGLTSEIEAAGFQIHMRTAAAAGRSGFWDLWRTGPAGLIIHLGGAGEAAWSLAREARRRRPRLPVLYLAGRREDWSSKGVPWSLMFEEEIAPRRLLSALNGLLNREPPPSRRSVGALRAYLGR